MLKICSNLGIEETLSLIWDIDHKNPAGSQPHSSHWNTKILLLGGSTKQDCLFSPLLISSTLEVLANTTSWEEAEKKEKKISDDVPKNCVYKKKIQMYSQIFLKLREFTKVAEHNINLPKWSPIYKQQSEN